MRTDTADYWRHARMYEPAKSFLHRPDLTIVTIGDGRFGLDSIRLRRMGFTNVLPIKVPPDEATTRFLRENDWSYMKLPRNPHI